MIIKKSLVVLPAYNESKGLSELLEKLMFYFGSKQIILADDGSTDNTREIAREKNIQIIHNPNNSGKGFILRHTYPIILDKFPWARWIFTLDADGQHSIEDFEQFFQIINKKNVDILVGKRNYDRMPARNRLSNKITSHWCTFWLRWNISDVQCGFRCYKRSALLEIINRGLTKNKFDLETEILFIAWFLNKRIQEIPIKTIYKHSLLKGNSKRNSYINPSIDTARWIFLSLEFFFRLEFMRKIWKTQRTRKR